MARNDTATCMCSVSIHIALGPIFCLTGYKHQIGLYIQNDQIFGVWL